MCGVSNTPGVVGVDRKSHADRIGYEVISNRFEMCKDLTYEELEKDFKIKTELIYMKGRIRLTVGMKRNLRAMLL